MAEIDLSGFTRFNISVNLTADEIAEKWPPEKIQAWFDGVAQVVRAAGESATVEIIEPTEREAEDG